MMNKSNNKLPFVTQTCFSAVVTLFLAASAGAQTLPTPPATTSAAAGPPLFTVTHDGTLQGDGRVGSPLGITASPTVGSLTVNGDIHAKNIVSTNSTVKGALAVTGNVHANVVIDDVITVNSVFAHSIRVDARQTGFSAAMVAGGSTLGIFGRGGAGIGPTGSHPTGGIGVDGMGGFFIFDPAIPRVSGVGVSGLGGSGINGGAGVRGDGANTAFFTGSGGVGVSAHGGNSSSGGNGGAGVVARGRGTIQPGNVGGLGVFAFGGPANLGASSGLAADLDGDVLISGRLVKGSGSFKIDHPLDPENKYLSHSFVESPDMMNIYNGNVTTDSNGDALVQLPEYFAALNRDFRYQLTTIGTFADSIVAEKIIDNHFRIKTSLPNVKVSWQVTGIRQDAYANKNRISVEEDKSEADRGFYLHPEAFGQPLEKSILMAIRAALQQK